MRHVEQHLIDGGELILGLLELEALREFLVLAPRMGKSVALLGLAGGVDFKQLRRHRQHRFLGAILDPVP